MRQHQSKIEGTKAVIEQLQQQQNDLYDILIEEIKPTEEQENWLWEYCFNAHPHEASVEYSMMIGEGIYGV